MRFTQKPVQCLWKPSVQCRLRVLGSSSLVRFSIGELPDATGYHGPHLIYFSETQKPAKMVQTETMILLLPDKKNVESTASTREVKNKI